MKTLNASGLMFAFWDCFKATLQNYIVHGPHRTHYQQSLHGLRVNDYIDVWKMSYCCFSRGRNVAVYVLVNFEYTPYTFTHILYLFSASLDSGYIE